MKITVNVEKLMSGKYCAMLETPNGPTCGDGLTIEGVCRVVCIAVIDALEESIELEEFDSILKG